MSLNFLDELDITSSGDNVLQGFSKAKNNFAWLDDVFHGFANRAKFRWKDADEIYIGPGVYHHEGTTNQTVYWNSELTFKLGSAGSNSDSTDLGVSQWHYIYIDDSAVVTAGTNLLTASEFLNSTTAPSWSASKHGWYNSSDRCIFAVLTDASSNILEFFHSGDFVRFGNNISEVSNSKPSDSWTDLNLSSHVPAFTIRAQVYFFGSYQDATSAMMYRTNGQSGGFGINVGYINSETKNSENSVAVITDASQVIEYRFDTASTDNGFWIYTHGWYFPEGM